MTYRWEYQFENQFPFAAIKHIYDSPEGRLHQHDYLEIALCVSGEGYFLYENDRQEIHEGDVFFLDQYFDHVAVAKERHPITLILLLFSVNIANTIWLNNDSDDMLRTFWRSVGRSPFKIPNQEGETFKIQAKILHIFDIWKNRPWAYQLLLDGKLKVLLAQCLQYHMDYYTDVQVENIQRKKEFEIVFEYIKEHLHKKIVLADLCAITHLSETQFRIRFKQATNMNFVKYLDQLRIAKATQLLISTELSIRNISLQVGLTNTNRFYALFKKLIGLSPGEYRKKASSFSYYFKPE